MSLPPGKTKIQKSSYAERARLISPKGEKMSGGGRTGRLRFMGHHGDHPFVI